MAITSTPRWSRHSFSLTSIDTASGRETKPASFNKFRNSNRRTEEVHMKNQPNHARRPLGLILALVGLISRVTVRRTSMLDTLQKRTLDRHRLGSTFIL